MPVTIRRRSWEDHVTHRSAPRYSYDDLDLVCCPGVRKDGPCSRRGRRERCASMPECCHPGVATFATEDRRPQIQQEDAGEKESSETSLADVFESESVQNYDIFADQSQTGGYSLDPPTAARATELDGDGGKASPNQPDTLAKNPTASETAPDAPLDPPNDNNIRSHRDDLVRPEVADSDCPVAQYPNDLTASDTETSLARHPNVLDAPKAPANPAQTTVAADRADAAQKEDSTAATLDPHATSTAWENAPAPLSCRVHPSGFEESSVLKADMLDRVPSIELATGESVPDHKPDAVHQGHMTGEAECCERPGNGQTDLGRPDADISGMEVTQEARGPEGLALATAHEVRGSSAQAAQTSGACKSEGSPSAQKQADYEHLKTHLEAFSGEPGETAMREGASSESPESLSVDVECSQTTGASQEKRHEGACGGSKLDTILEVSLSETGDEIGGAERQDKEDSKATVQLLSPTPKETGESPGPEGGVGVEPPSSNNMALDQGPEGHQSNKSLTSTCSGQLVLCEAEDFSSKMAAIEEEGLDAGRCHPTLPTSSEPTEQQEPRTEENTVKLRVRKSSREERERSRLDSMVLLIMKLDQLDQEIESALSSTSSIVSTPTLRRKGISEMDLGTLSEAGSVSASTQSLHSPLHRLSSSSSSTGPAGPSGAKPKSGILAVVSEKDKAEIEAKEACNWLRAAGFPQYAQLYEDGQFPIEISSVTRDHDFLDGDAIEALCRRLHTLNKCALMRLDVSPQRKRSDDSDEDEPCAISGRWTFQRDSKRWSRMDELDVFSPPGVAGEPPFPSEERLRQGVSTESVLTDLSEQPEVSSLHSGGSGGGERRDGESERGGRLPSTTPSSPGAGASMSTASGGATRASSVASVCSSATSGANEDSLSDGLPSPLEMRSFSFEVKSSSEERGGGGVGGGGGKSSGSTSTRSRAKSFLKRMESLRLRGGTLTRRKKPRSKLDISGPVGIQEGLDEEKLRRLNCVDIHPALTQTLQSQNQDQDQKDGSGGSGVIDSGPHSHRHRSVSYFTQTSSGSAGSSQSEGGSSGSAVSTPSPVTRARSHSSAASGSKRGGMYLEGFDPFNLLTQPAQDHQTQNNKHNLNTIQNQNQNLDLNKNQSATDGVVEQNRRNSKRSASSSSKYEAEEEVEEEEVEEGVIFFYLPEGHKPGTFPKALADGGLRRHGVEGGASTIRRRPRRGSSTSLDSRLSVYDNVPVSLSRGIGGEEDEDEAHLERDGEHKLEKVLKDVSGLQRLVNAWTEAVATGEEEEEEEEEDEEEEDGDSDSALDSASPCPSSPLQNRLEEENASDQDSTGNPLGERERRDSGVGASLTRANRPQKLRWPSFQSSHRPSLSSTLLQIGCQSVLQMNLLQKYSLLKLTALLEKHTPTNKHGFSWAVPKFMKRMKARDYKDRNVFGIPLHVNVQRTGQPLPQSIQQAMRYLRSQCLDQVGLFRKSGVKSRIQALRQMNEACGADGGGVSYEGQSAYDVADMLKQYFRDLPEPLFTTKLSDTFLQIYQCGSASTQDLTAAEDIATSTLTPESVQGFGGMEIGTQASAPADQTQDMPKEQRLQAVRAAVLLLPDEARDTLQSLLCFLSDVTASVADNQMTCTNLAVCLAPSLFHLNTLRRDSSSPRVMNRKQTLGKPDQRDLNENLAATHGLAHMIQECRKLFQIPEEMSRCRNSYVEQGLSPVRMEELLEGCGPQGYRTHLRDSLDALLKEAKDKFRGYDSVSTPEPAELAYKKVHDGSPLRMWKASVEVPASAEEVLSRVLREQQRWDEDLLEGRVVETLEERAEVYQYVRNSMAPHPPRDHVVLRTWQRDLPKGACALVSASVDHDRAAVMGVRANILTSRYYMEPCGQNKTRLTHISRVDCRGRFPEWYNKLYGHQCAAEVVRIRDSFTSPMEK